MEKLDNAIAQMLNYLSIIVFSKHILYLTDRSYFCLIITFQNYLQGDGMGGGAANEEVRKNMFVIPHFDCKGWARINNPSK